MSQDSGYPLPSIIDPETSIHVCIPVPDEPAHRQAFAGALLTLTRWYNWARDPEHKGTQVAKVWQDIVFGVFDQLDLRLEDCVNCDDIVQCVIDTLNATGTLHDSLISALTGAGFGLSNGGNSTGTPNSELGGIDFNNGLSCDPDSLYSKCLAIVSALDTLSVDMFDIIEVLTNNAEIAAEMADNIPVFQQVLGTLADTVTWLQDNITEEYAASYNATSQDALACEIYCLLTDCTITLDTIRNGYRAALDSYTPPASNVDFLTFMQWLMTITNIGTDTIVVASIHLMILEVLARTGTWYGANYTRIKSAIADDSGSVSPTCGCCPPVLFTFAVQSDATPISAQSGTTIQASWESNTWTGGLPCWLAGQHYFVPAPAEPSRYGWIVVNVDPDCYYSQFSCEMYAQGFNDSNLSVALWDTQTIPQNGTGAFATATDNTPNPDGYRTLGTTFTSRNFPNGYVVIGFGSGGAYINGPIRIKNFSLS